MLSVTRTVLPGPVQASGSSNVPETRLTVTVKLHEAVLFAESATEQVTVVTPTGKPDPEAGVQVGVLTPEQLSPTVGGAQVATTGVPVEPKKIFAGQVIEGGCVSLTFTVKLHDGPATELQVTVDVPIGKNDPEAGRQVIAPQTGSTGEL